MMAGHGARVMSHESRVTSHGSTVTGHGSRVTGHGLEASYGSMGVSVQADAVEKESNDLSSSTAGDLGRESMVEEYG